MIQRVRHCAECRRVGSSCGRSAWRVCSPELPEFSPLQPEQSPSTTARSSGWRPLRRHCSAASGRCGAHLVAVLSWACFRRSRYTPSALVGTTSRHSPCSSCWSHCGRRAFEQRRPDGASVSAVDVAQALWLLLAALGLSVSVSYTGLPVLGQSAYIAVGGYSVGLLGPGGMGLPLGIAAAAAVLMAAVLGYVTALSFSRLDDSYLALATWALAWLAEGVVLAYPAVFGGPEGLTRPVPARLVSHTLGVEIVLTTNVNLVIAALLCILGLAALVRIDKGAVGLDLTALRESARLAASLGVPVEARRRTALAVTAALGAASGVGSTVLLGIISPSDISPLLSLQLFVAVLLGGARWWGPVLGATILLSLPPVADELASAADVSPEHVRGLLTAALLIGVLLLRGPVRRLVRTLRYIAPSR